MLSAYRDVGFTLILIVSPVAADLSAVVEEKERADPNAFGPGGAYAQAFALFNCAMAAGTLFGPVAAGTIVNQHGWGAVTAFLGVFAFSGAVPAVSPSSRTTRVEVQNGLLMASAVLLHWWMDIYEDDVTKETGG